MHTQLRQYFNEEIQQSHAAKQQGDFSKAWHHLERAHILGQCYVKQHIMVHYCMLKLALIENEIIGQLLRLVLAVPGTLSGKLPIGNTGRAKVSISQPMKIPEDLQKILDNK